jgi:hypothetical protein
MTLVGLQVMVQLLCLLTVFSITKSLRLGSWIVWLYAISILGPMVPLIVTFGLVRTVMMYTIPAWSLALSLAAPCALAMIAIRCHRRAAD